MTIPKQHIEPLTGKVITDGQWSLDDGLFEEYVHIIEHELARRMTREQCDCALMGITDYNVLDNIRLDIHLKLMKSAGIEGYLDPSYGQLKDDLHAAVARKIHYALF